MPCSAFEYARVSGVHASTLHEGDTLAPAENVQHLTLEELMNYPRSDDVVESSEESARRVEY